ncbi:hypothetical protein ACFP3T_00410 [Lactiplantibacillus dongliensis]|uniref:Uncharacterized protein n=1 Tax=Lactiplantibacillus dongliensis TaxID=2559919 RepID=A0ABW1R003_9LACO|nr:hypothetical protein [Lactiplantibacillus dongliensis]
MNKIIKRLTLGLATVAMLGGALTSLPATAQAAKSYKVTETTGTDGTHYFTVDGKHYTPAQFAAWEASFPKDGYDIAHLKAKKTKNRRSIKVTGKVKISNTNLAKQHKATYVRIKTYKGNQYAKLTKSKTFSKTIEAPKAKTVTVQPGYYRTVKKQGKIVKHFHVWGAKKKTTVKAYK